MSRNSFKILTLLSMDIPDTEIPTNVQIRKENNTEFFIFLNKGDAKIATVRNQLLRLILKHEFSFHFPHLKLALDDKELV